ncbi:hypothetical protein Slin14017_G044350 [Septoria linicola]|nr:hypothetical protein Slin14017_G044350 [Septoria linicola]
MHGSMTMEHLRTETLLAQHSKPPSQPKKMFMALGAHGEDICHALCEWFGIAADDVSEWEEEEDEGPEHEEQEQIEPGTLFVPENAADPEPETHAPINFDEVQLEDGRYYREAQQRMLAARYDGPIPNALSDSPFMAKLSHNNTIYTSAIRGQTASRPLILRLRLEDKHRHSACRRSFNLYIVADASEQAKELGTRWMQLFFGDDTIDASDNPELLTHIDEKLFWTQTLDQADITNGDRLSYLLYHRWGPEEHAFYFGQRPTKEQYELLQGKTNDYRDQVQDK